MIRYIVSHILPEVLPGGGEVALEIIYLSVSRPKKYFKGLLKAAMVCFNFK